MNSGLFITQDGEDNGESDGSTNFKYVSWSDIVRDNPFLAPYADLASDFDPRNISAVAEPASLAMMLAGLAVIAKRRRKANGAA